MPIIVGDFFTYRRLEIDKLKLPEFPNSLFLMKIMNEYDILSIFQVRGLLVNPWKLYNKF